MDHAGIVLWMRPANERWSLIGWAHSQNEPWSCNNNPKQAADQQYRTGKLIFFNSLALEKSCCIWNNVIFHTHTCANLKISDQTLVSLWWKNESYSTVMILGIYVGNIVGHVCAKYLWVICHSFIFTVLLVGSRLVRRGLYISVRYISIVLPLA